MHKCKNNSFKNIIIKKFNKLGKSYLLPANTIWRDKLYVYIHIQYNLYNV